MALDWYNGTRTNIRNNSSATGGGLGQHNSTDFLLDPAWGVGGTTVQGTLSKGAVDALKGGMSTANPDDIAAQDALRDYWTTQLGQVGANSRNQMSQFDTQSQRGLASLLQQQKNSQAGTGLIGSRQASNAAGDITQRLASQYMQGVTANRQQELNNASSIQNALQNIYSNDLNERNFQLNQGKTLADQYNRMWDQQQGRESSLSASRGSEGNWVSDVAPLVGTVGGAILGGPAGAMIGGSIGSALGGAVGGSGGGGGGGSNLAALLALQNSGGGGGSSISPYLGDYSGMNSPSSPAQSSNPYLSSNPYWYNF